MNRAATASRSLNYCNALFLKGSIKNGARDTTVGARAGQARARSCRQPVSSTLTAAACWNAARASSTTGARAALGACSWRITAPNCLRCEQNRAATSRGL